MLTKVTATCEIKSKGRLSESRCICWQHVNSLWTRYRSAHAERRIDQRKRTSTRGLSELI